MASDVVPHGIKIEWNATQNGVPVVNRVYTVVTGTPNAGNLTEASIAALNFFNAVKEAYHPTYILGNITVTDVSVANGAQLILPLTTDNVGTSAGTAAAGNAAVVCSLRTAQIGRSFRGRFYFGALSNNNLLTAQTIGAPAATFYADAMSDFLDALQDIGQTLVVVSKFAAGVARVVALATEVISLVVDTKVDSQRRRTAN